MDKIFTTIEQVGGAYAWGITWIFIRIKIR